MPAFRQPRRSPTTGLYLPGTVGTYASTPDAASLDITGDLEVLIHAKANDWTPASARTLIAKRTTEAGLSWQFALATNGELQFSFRSGATDYFANSAGQPTLVDGTAYWIRLRRRASDGDVDIHIAPSQPDEPSVWTGVTVVGTQTAGALAANDAPLEVGSNRAGQQPWAGAIYRAIVRNGIGGTTVADFRADAPVGPRYRDATGKVWTLNGSDYAWEHL